MSYVKIAVAVEADQTTHVKRTLEATLVVSLAEDSKVVKPDQVGLPDIAVALRALADQIEGTIQGRAAGNGALMRQTGLW